MTVFAITRNDVADYVDTLILIYLVLIFIRIILTWIPRIPYNPVLNAVIKFVTDVTVARKIAETRQHQVTHPGKAGQRIRASSKSDSQSGHLRQTARHQRRRAIVAQPQAVDRASGDRHNIFYGAADLNSDHIIVRINSKAAGRKRILRDLRPLR